MKITRDFLRQVITESIDEMGIPVQTVAGIDRGGGVEGYNDEDVDAVAFRVGVTIIGLSGSRLQKYLADKNSKGFLSSLKGTLKTELSNVAKGIIGGALHGDWALHNMSMEEVFKGMVIGARKNARNSLVTALTKNENTIVSALESIKQNVLQAYPEAGIDPGREEEGDWDPGRGGQGSSSYKTVGSKRKGF